jgi:type I restriction enzyme S subunit
MWEIKSSITKRDIPYELPANWSWFHWGDLILDYEQGLIRSNSQLGSGNAFYLKMGDLDNNGGCSLSGLAETQATPNEITAYRLHEGDFLINVRNSVDLVGKTCVIGRIGQKDVLFNHMLVRIRHRDSITSSFINAFLTIPSSRKLIDRCKQGTTTVIALYKRDLLRVPIPLPDRITLDHISGFYDAVAAKIELNKRINAELEGMAKLLYDYWFVQFDFPMTAAQAASLGKPQLAGKPYRSSGGKMIYNEVLKREIPEGWKGGTLENVLTLQYGKALKKDTQVPGDYPVYGSGGIYGSHNVPLVQGPGIIVGRKGSVGELYWSNISFYPTDTSYYVEPKAGMDLNYAYFLLKRLPLKSMNSDSAVPGLSRIAAYQLPATLPDKPLIAEFGKIATPLRAAIANNEKQNQELTQLRDWLLPMLMNGQVTVN